MALSKGGRALSRHRPRTMLDTFAGIMQRSSVLRTITLYMMIVLSTTSIRPQFRMSSPDTQADKQVAAPRHCTPLSYRKCLPASQLLHESST